jgi:hypothetical protein
MTPQNCLYLIKVYSFTHIRYAGLVTIHLIYKFGDILIIGVEIMIAIITKSADFNCITVHMLTNNAWILIKAPQLVW